VHNVTDILHSTISMYRPICASHGLPFTGPVIFSSSSQYSLDSRTANEHRRHTKGNLWWNQGEPPKQATLALKKGDTSMNKMFQALEDHPLVVDSNGDFNQKAGGNYIYLCFSRGCKATKVTGQWVTHGGQIASTGEESWTYGTDYTHSESETESWSNSVTKSVNLGFSFKGVSGSVDISGTKSHEISLSYSYSWSTTTSDTYSVDFDKSMIGKQPWQFQFTPYDSCGHTEVSAAKALAITEGAYQPPCCLPGYAKDAPAYKTCVSADAMIPNGTAYGCTVAASAESSAVLV